MGMNYNIYYVGSVAIRDCNELRRRRVCMHVKKFVMRYFIEYIVLL